MKPIFLILFLSISTITFSQNNIFIATNGANNSGLGTFNSPYASLFVALNSAQAGDTVFVRGGTYQNYTLGDGDIWKGQAHSIFSINHVHGMPNQYITIKPYNNEQVIVKGDGLAMILVKNSSYIRIEGFEVYGETENIPLDTALAYQFIYKDANNNIQYRVPPLTPSNVVDTMTFPILSNIKRPTFFNTAGISVLASHHIDVVNNYVHHAPGEGIRSFTSDYLNIIGNEIHDCSRRSSTGVHGLSVYNLSNIDSLDIQKILIARNLVYDNYNEVYSWTHTKTIITPHNDEGKGITVQRCSPAYSWTSGKIRIENNIAHHNGFSGFHINTGKGIEIVNNTAYYNSRTTATEGNGNQHGISVQGGEDILIANNIAVADTSILQNRVLNLSNNSINITIKNNLLIGNLSANAAAIDVNTFICSPHFKDVLNDNYRLKYFSCAIDAADFGFAPSIDFFKNTRDNSPDLGAIEFAIFSSLFQTKTINNTLKVYPNPFQNTLKIKGDFEKENISVFNTLGQKVMVSFFKNKHEVILNGQHLQRGFYFIKIGNRSVKVFKL